MVFIKGFILLGILSAVMGRPQDPPPAPAPVPVASGSGSTPATIISQTESIDANGNFNFSYETSDGIKVEEAGVLKHVTGLKSRANAAVDGTQPDEDDILVQTGSFSYTAPDGTKISLRYTADENGFQPVGDHLPTSPPIPADILRSLPQAGEQQSNPAPVPAAAEQPHEQVVPANNTPAESES